MKKVLRSSLTKGAVVLASLSSFAFAASNSTPKNLQQALPTSVLDSSIWIVAGLVIAAVVAVKSIQIVMRLIKRV